MNVREQCELYSHLSSTLTYLEYATDSLIRATRIKGICGKAKKDFKRMTNEINALCSAINREAIK